MRHLHHKQLSLQIDKMYEIRVLAKVCPLSEGMWLNETSNETGSRDDNRPELVGDHPVASEIS